MGQKLLADSEDDPIFTDAAFEPILYRKEIIASGAT
jgi:hypothetical protein